MHFIGGEAGSRMYFEGEKVDVRVTVLLGKMRGGGKRMGEAFPRKGGWKSARQESVTKCA